MNNLDKLLSRLAETARDENGVRQLVYLQERGVVVNLETCTEPELLSAAIDQLAHERACLSYRIAQLEAARNRRKEAL